MSYEKFSYEVKDQVAHIGFGYNCNKSMTVLDEATLTELNTIVDELGKNRDLKGAIFFSHKDGCFIAGADINLISSMKTETDGAKGAEAGQEVFNKLEDLKIPTIACVNGVCLGGGMEFALSCQAIICSDDKKTGMGLPEVKLGLIPGFGGTYRMPKKVGLPTALDLILSGKMLKAKKAKKVGLVEGVYPKERLVAMAPSHFVKKAKKTSLTDTLTENFLTKKIIFQKARESVLKKTKGFYEAPLKILDTMEAGMLKGRASYMASEAQTFGELCVGDQSRNLQHLFFMMEGAKKFKGSELKPRSMDRGACLGAGTMGGGIAWLMADSGMAPLMKDLSVDALELGLKQSSSNFGGALKRRKMTKDEFTRKQSSIRPTLTYDGFKTVDLVVEAVVENMDIKKKVFAELETKVNDQCLITSNTSSLSVEEMATALEKPGRFAGLHFFNPVHRMPLVEIITHSKVDEQTLVDLHKWCLKVKKTPVIVGDGPGFLVNRILMPFLNEAAYLLEEGVSIEDIDKAILNFGMPMGACRLMDEVGIDVGMKVAKIIHDGLGDRAKANDQSSKMVEKGLLGRKTSKGFYVYDEKGKDQGINPEVLSLLPSKRKKMSEKEIQMRCILPMINEAAYILEDKIVDTADQVDLGLIFGIGFPPFRGGLLKYADSEGLEAILGALEEREKSVDSDRYAPAPLLRKLVEEKKSFYEYRG